LMCLYVGSGIPKCFNAAVKLEKRTPLHRMLWRSERFLRMSASSQDLATDSEILDVDMGVGREQARSSCDHKAMC
jgi:hypothetical protein